MIALIYTNIYCLVVFFVSFDTIEAGCAIPPDTKGHVTIPHNWTSIGNNAFSYCSGLTSVTIPDSVTSIGDWAFYGCSKLTICRIEPDDNGGVMIPNEWKSILSYSFYRCSSLRSVTIGDNVTSIGGSAFEECSDLTSVTIPDLSLIHI